MYTEQIKTSEFVRKITEHAIGYTDVIREFSLDSPAEEEETNMLIQEYLESIVPELKALHSEIYSNHYGKTVNILDLIYLVRMKMDEVFMTVFMHDAPTLMEWILDWHLEK